MAFIEIISFSVQEQYFSINNMKLPYFLVRNLLAFGNYLSSVFHLQSISFKSILTINSRFIKEVLAFHQSERLLRQV